VQRLEINPLNGMVVKILLDIQLPPDFPEKYKAAVIRSADQCAVKKHFEQPPQFEISTSMVDELVAV
jgi:ribosomal protein S12 methylthiotransferase accessory factor